MSKTQEAILADGRKLPYVVTDNPPRGGMKYTYFAPDKSYVIQFYNDPRIANDPNVHTRINAIIGKYNPTKPEDSGGARGNDDKTSQYFSKYFCWPTAIVTSPEFGIVCPAYPSHFFFNASDSCIADLNLSGKDKRSNWFTTKNRKYLSKDVLGTFRSMVQMSIILARSVRRMHQAGLAHSDLSNNNVLIDPKSGTCVVIDIDSLVVPGIFPPEVIGTRGYIAPEVQATLHLRFDDSRRKMPSTQTDLHALAVLIYEYLLMRHPLMGPKIYSRDSAEEDDHLGLGERATFIENPHDTSNRPKDLRVTIKHLGPILENLFIRAFVDGLHAPNERPTAMEWEKGLVQTWDLLHPCSNPKCEQKFFVLHDINKPVCPFCQTKTQEKQLVRFKLKSETRGRSGQWMNCGEINVYDQMPLFKWHIYRGLFPDEKADRTLHGYVTNQNGMWLLVNSAINGMQSPAGNLVPIGQCIELKDGIVFKASREVGGLLVEVVVKNVL